MSNKVKGLRGALKLAAGALVATPAMVLANSPPPPPPPPPSPPPPAAKKVNGSQFFAWYDNTTDVNYPVAVAPPQTGTYIGTPFLTNANAAAVNTYFASLPSTAIRAVKVENPGISNATANLIFNNSSYNVSYVFGDREGTNATTLAATLVKQVRYKNQTSSSSGLSKSAYAYVGNFGFSLQACNNQKPSYYNNCNPQHSFSDYGFSICNSVGLSMSNEEAYPGSPSMRNKAGGDSPQGGGTYPNIRSSLFVLPSWRVADVSDSIIKSGLSSTSHQNIPWTGNFNNWNNPALDTDRNNLNGYLYKPGFAMSAKTVNGHNYPALTAAQTTNQILSEKDFATMITHMRLRGADSFHLLDSGLVGVSQATMQKDAATGWLGESSINNIFAQTDKKLLIGNTAVPTSYDSSGKFNSTTTIWIQSGSSFIKKNIDQTGAIFSGAYSVTSKQLDVLISNMADGSLTIRLPSTIGTYALATTDFTLSGGDHKLVEYTLQKVGTANKWVVAGQHVPFTAISNIRSGFGIPEPGTLSLLAVAGVFGLNRRKRNVR